VGDSFADEIGDMQLAKRGLSIRRDANSLFAFFVKTLEFRDHHPQLLPLVRPLISMATLHPIPGIIFYLALNTVIIPVRFGPRRGVMF
jgi:hypothetical protein